MFLNEAIELVKNKEYQYITFKSTKYVILDSGFLQEYHGDEFYVSSADMLCSDEWDACCEILPKNVRRDAEGNLKEHRITDIWINVYRSYIDKEIRETIHITERDANMKGCDGIVWKFVKTLHLQQQYSVPYIKGV